MHFSVGQWAFVGFFAVAFIAALVWSYLKDKPESKKYYKGTWWKVLAAFVVFTCTVVFIFRLIKSH